MTEAKTKTDLSQEPGIKNAEKIFGKEIANRIADFWATDVDADFAKEICNYAYGFMYSRNVLSPKQRELCSCMALTVINHQDELAAHIKAAINCGATVKEITEVIIQAHLYAGIPATMSGLKTLRSALGKEEVDLV